MIVMGGAQLLSIGLIGEYLAHVFEEVKGRPLYLFKYESRQHQESSKADRTSDRAANPGAAPIRSRFRAA